VRSGATLPGSAKHYLIARCLEASGVLPSLAVLTKPDSSANFSQEGAYSCLVKALSDIQSIPTALSITCRFGATVPVPARHPARRKSFRWQMAVSRCGVGVLRRTAIVARDLRTRRDRSLLANLVPRPMYGKEEVHSEAAKNSGARRRNETLGTEMRLSMNGRNYRQVSACAGRGYSLCDFQLPASSGCPH
jgi:hypothetical protein